MQLEMIEASAAVRRKNSSSKEKYPKVVKNLVS